MVCRKQKRPERGVFIEVLAETKSYGNRVDINSYIDYSRIETEGQYKSIWDLVDFKLPQTNSSGKKFKSSISKHIVDCQAFKSQIVTLNHYSEQMGKGELVNSISRPVQESKWKDPPPNTNSDEQIKIACGRK